MKNPKLVTIILIEPSKCHPQLQRLQHYADLRGTCTSLGHGGASRSARGFQIFPWFPGSSFINNTSLMKPRGSRGVSPEVCDMQPGKGNGFPEFWKYVGWKSSLSSAISNFGRTQSNILLMEEFLQHLGCKKTL